MRVYGGLVHDLDAEGAHYSSSLSEVDLSDPEDVKITIADSGGAVLVHLGNTQFLERYKIYLAHVEEWRQRFNKLESVDLRYDRQVIVNPETTGHHERTDSSNATKPQTQASPAPRSSHPSQKTREGGPPNSALKPVAPAHVARSLHDKRHR
jgi:cell division protein FtsQ